MRISSNTIYEQGVAGLQRQTSDLIRTQQQISANRRMLTPSDDPVAASKVLEVSQSQSLNKQFDVNTGSASSKLGLQDSILGSIGELIQSIQTTAVYAGNGALTNTDRDSLAQELRSNYQELMGLVNATDDSGNYMFSGYKGATRPFSETAPGVVAYSGDEGQRLIQISPSRQIPVSDSGSTLFQQIKNGNGTFVSRAASTNGGTGIIDPGTVIDPAAWIASNKDYTLRFAGTTDIVSGALNTGAATVKAGIVNQTTWDAGGKALDVTFAGGPTHGSALGTAPAVLTVTTGATDQLDITVDGTNAVVTIPPGAPYASAGALAAAMETAINANATMTGAGKSVTVTESLGVLTITSNSLGVGSSVTVAIAGANDAAANLLGGVPTPTAGTTVPFTYTVTDTVNLTSTSGSYTPGPTPLTVSFEGADIVLSGTPAAGDVFKIGASFTPGWTYDIIDNTTSTSLLSSPASASSWSSSWRSYTTGQAITLTNQGAEPAFDFGISTKLDGGPAGGDTFTIKASQNEDIFASLHSLITALETGSSTPASSARLSNDLILAMSSFNNGQINVLKVRASVGAHMREVDSVKSTGEDLQLQYQQTISNLQDLDYAKAITDLTRQRTSLEAAQMSFVKVEGLSLFNYM